MNASKAKSKDQKLKISGKAAAEFAISNMVQIRASDAPNSVKAQKERRLGKSCLIKLAGRSSRSKENKPSLSYFNREVTSLRTAIRHEGFIRHDFNDKIKALAEHHPIASKELLTLVDVIHNEAKELIADTVAKLHNRYSRTKDSEKKAELKNAIAKLKKVKYEPVIFETLVRTTAQKDELAKAAEKRVEGYHEVQRPIDYHKTYELMGKLLTAEHNWMALTFGLVLASGRRSTEIVCHLDGEFKPTKNSREAEFTTVVKTKESKTYKIPLLVDFETFSAALERLRSHSRISRVMDRAVNLNSYDQRHKELNSSLQQQLNEFVKSEMGKGDWWIKGVFSSYEEYCKSEAIKAKAQGKKYKPGDEWRLKDGRAMYARITYAEHCATAKKAGRVPVADDLFFKRNLGHSDPATQQNYKQFTVVNMETLTHREVKQTKIEAESVESRDRLQELVALFDTEAVRERRAFAKYADWVIEQVKADPAVKITSTWIKTGTKGNKGIILEFVRLVKEAGLQTAF